MNDNKQGYVAISETEIPEANWLQKEGNWHVYFVSEDMAEGIREDGQSPFLTMFPISGDDPAKVRPVEDESMTFMRDPVTKQILAYHLMPQDDTPPQNSNQSLLMWELEVVGAMSYTIVIGKVWEKQGQGGAWYEWAVYPPAGHGSSPLGLTSPPCMSFEEAVQEGLGAYRGHYAQVMEQRPKERATMGYLLFATDRATHSRYNLDCLYEEEGELVCYIATIPQGETTRFEHWIKEQRQIVNYYPVDVLGIGEYPDFSARGDEVMEGVGRSTWFIEPRTGVLFHQGRREGFSQKTLKWYTKWTLVPMAKGKVESENYGTITHYPDLETYYVTAGAESSTSRLLTEAYDFVVAQFIASRTMQQEGN